MLARITFNLSVILALACSLLVPHRLRAQQSTGAPVDLTQVFQRLGSLDIVLKGPNGEAISRSAVVTLIRLNGQLYTEALSKSGRVQIGEIPATQFDLRIVAPGYATITKRIEIRESANVKLTIQLEATAEGIDAISDREMAALGPKAQKALGKAIEALRMKKIVDARASLDAAHRLAPNSAEVQYLYGVLERDANNEAQATSYWAKTLELDPQHYRALIAMSEWLLHENKPSEAVTYLDRAAKVEPTAWRPHALYTEAHLKQGSTEEAIREAERAQELGHGKAADVMPLLAAALFNHGEVERATTVLQGYLKEHPSDAKANEELAAIKAAALGGPSTKSVESTALEREIVDGLPSNWLPADIDERVGSLEPGAVCALDEVLKKTGDRIHEFLENVNRFTATESLQHESINKWGISAQPISRRFNYVVGVQEIRSGFFNVEEYRTSTSGGDEFPDGIATNGLPAMILILHPHNVPNFDITCEGLAQWNGKPAWQIHFRQRSDRPNTIRTYRMGLQGQAYPVGLKGRAWIAADTLQVVRMETQMIAPLREIKLLADYTAIEYGPVHFNKRHLDMWLPQTAEVYSDWRGRRFHRTHSFSHYMLYSVDEKQTISAPKEAAEAAPKTEGETERPNP